MKRLGLVTHVIHHAAEESIFHMIQKTFDET
jgi:hypothetical protein